MAQSEAVRIAVILLGGLLAGCELAPVVLHLPFPADARSALVVLEADDEPEYFAVDPTVEPATALLTEHGGIGPARPLEVTVAAYAEGLEDLALVPGPVRSSEGGEALPEALTVEQAVVTEAAPSFAPIDPPAALRAFLRPAAPECLRTIAVDRRWDFPAADGETVGVVPLADGRVGLAHRGLNQDTTILEPQEDGTMLPGEVIPSSALEVYQIQADAQGTWWVAGLRFPTGGVFGRWRGGRLEPEIEPSGTPSPTPGDWPLAFAFADPAEGEGVVYLVSNDGALKRVGRAGVEVLVPPTFYFGRRPSVAVAGPDEVYFVRAGTTGVVHYRGGVHEVETTDVDAAIGSDSEYILSLGVAADGSAYAGTQRGVFLRRDDSGHFRQLAREVLVGAGIWTMVPFGAGILGGGDYGALRQVYPRRNLPCEDNTYISNEDTVLAFLLRPGEIWAGGRRRVTMNDRPPVLVRLRY